MCREVIQALIVLPSLMVAAPALARDAEAAKAAYVSMRGRLQLYCVGL